MLSLSLDFRLAIGYWFRHRDITTLHSVLRVVAIEHNERARRQLADKAAAIALGEARRSFEAHLEAETEVERLRKHTYFMEQQKTPAFDPVMSK